MLADPLIAPQPVSQCPNGLWAVSRLSYLIVIAVENQQQDKLSTVVQIAFRKIRFLGFLIRVEILKPRVCNLCIHQNSVFQIYCNIARPP